MYNYGGFGVHCICSMKILIKNTIQQPKQIILILFKILSYCYDLGSGSVNSLV